MSKSQSSVRASKTRAAEADHSRMEALESYVQQLNEKLADVVKSVPADKKRIQAIVIDTVGETLDLHADTIKKLMDDQGREGPDKSTIDAIRSEIADLKGEIKSLRSSVNAQLETLWTEVSGLQDMCRNQGPKKKSTDLEEVEFSKKREDRKSSRSRTRRRRQTSSSRRRKRRNESDLSEFSSEESDSHSESGNENEDEMYVADDDCRKALKVETYRLEDRNPERDTRLKTVKVLSTLRHLFDGDRFSGEDPLTALHFLEELKNVFDDASICEGDARHMFRYFLTGEALRVFKGLTGAERDSYPRIIRWVLRTYVRENLLQEARDEFFGRSQKVDETEQEYADALRELTRRCVGMLSEKEIVTRFVRGLNPAIRTHVRAKIHRETSWADAIALATEYGNAARESRKAEKRQDEKFFGTYQRRRPRPAVNATIRAKKAGLRDEESSDDQPEALEEVHDLADTDPIGAMPWSNRAISREPSFGSSRSAGTSSGHYYTPNLSPAPVPEAQYRNRRVVLPPGVPFPKRSVGEGSDLPCLGCSKKGHWIVDCKETPEETRELILEALRARKAKRAAKNANAGTSHVPEQRRPVLLAEKQSHPEGRDANESELPPETGSG